MTATRVAGKPDAHRLSRYVRHARGERERERERGGGGGGGGGGRADKPQWHAQTSVPVAGSRPGKRASI